jgi:hypothetical protein
MCGACGKDITKDPVIGDQRTLRKHLIVASTINGVWRDQRGAPKVLALAEGWLVTGPSGTSVLCSMVDDVWATVARLFFDPPVLATLLSEAALRLQTTGEEDLPRRTILAGARHAAL